ncbi:MAG: hypothetical protein ACK4YF_09065, partial [Exilispira sp.]
MNNYLLPFIEYILSFFILYIGISLYSAFPVDFKRKIFGITSGLIAFYYFLFATLQFSLDEKIIDWLNRFSLVSMITASSLTLLYLVEFLPQRYYIPYKKYAFISIFFSFVLSIIILFLDKNIVSLFYYKNIWVYKISDSIYFLVLIGYFVLLFIGFILFLIILMVNKLIKLLNFFIFFLLFFVLIILYFINKKNN